MLQINFHIALYLCPTCTLYKDKIMRTGIIILVLVFLVNISLFAKSSAHALTASNKNLHLSKRAVINTSDSVIFDLASATLTPTYIDIPIYIISDDVINSFDYALKFNMSKLTYSTTADLLPSDPTVISSAYFNPNDLFLRYTSSSLQGYPTNGAHVTKVRFNLFSPCLSVSISDFSEILTILNGTQCSNRVINLDFTKFVPTAAFNTGASCLNQNIQFNDLSTLSSGTITTWSWAFDNNNTSTIQNPLTSYTLSGSASATLIVSATTGCKDTVVKSLTINLLPAPSFTYSFNCIKDSVFFTNSSTITTGTIAGSNWDFGDATGTSNFQNPSYHYNASGIYTVTLLSTSDQSCTASKTLVVSLNNKVNANFSTGSTKPCEGSVISFSDASSYAGSPINAWSWDFGDGISGSVQNPNHSYTVSGTYSVTLTSSGSDGCKGFFTRTFTINPLPAAIYSIKSTTACSVDSINLNNSSTPGEGSSYSWDFGDGGSSILQNPSHSFTVASFYPIKLVVTTIHGCVDSLTKNYSVSLPPQMPGVFSNTIIDNGIVNFSNLTVGSASVRWNFGDNQVSTIQNPQHTFPETGTYKVCMISYDSSTCVSSLCKEIYVGLTKIIAVPSAFTPNADDINDLLTVKGGPISEMQFQIYNQWGNLIFQSSSQDNGWDGKFNGEPQPTGVYEYVLTGKTSDKKTVNLYGIVNLTR